MKNKRFSGYLFMISAIAVLISTALYITHWSYAPYLFAVGAAGIATVRLTDRYTGTNVRAKRLHRMEGFSALLILATSYLMFKDLNEWFLLLLIAAILQLYAALVMPKDE